MKKILEVKKKKKKSTPTEAPLSHRKKHLLSSPPFNSGTL